MHTLFAKKKNNGGYAMIMAICVLALVTVLAASLLLSASSVYSSAQQEQAREQCRITAVSLSREFDKMLTDTVYTFNTADEESAARDNSFWFYLKDGMLSGDWPYLNEDERGHTDRYAIRTFSFTAESLPDALKEQAGDISDTEVIIYWSSENGAQLSSSPLTVKITAKSGNISCTITAEYMLSVSQQYTERVDPITGVPVTVEYNQWMWSLNWRE